MPPLHPILVHFPIGIVVLAFCVQGLAQIKKRADLSRFAWWVQLSGAVAMLAAVISGYLSSQSIPIPEASRSTLETHEQLAFLTAAAMTVLVLWRAGHRGHMPSSEAGLYLLLFALCTMFLLTTGWFGGELVYKHALGLSSP